jgi:hypothetical protein
MAKVRFRVPVTLEVSESMMRMLEASAPLVRALRDEVNQKALRSLKDAGVVLGREVGRTIRAEQAKRPKRPRRKRV